MDSPSPDLQTKYHKLATEYSKARAQISVLKKAVVDEQGKSTEIKETLKERDLSLRKFEQEQESVLFRNQQLAKRVSILQEELDILTHKTKVKTSKKNEPPVSNSSANSQHVLNEELQNKIEENARLHHKVYQLKQENEEETAWLKERLETLEREAALHHEVLESTEASQRAVIQRLEEDHARLQIRFQEQDTQLGAMKYKAQDSERQLSIVQRDLGNKLESLNNVTIARLPFADNTSPRLNAFNIPVPNLHLQSALLETMNKLSGNITDLTNGLSNVFTYLEQRLHHVSFDGTHFSPVNQRFSQHLREGPSVLKLVNSSFQDLTATLQKETFFSLVNICDLSDSLTGFVNYLEKLVPYITLSLEEESNVPSCPSSLRDKNSLLVDLWRSVIAALNRLGSHIAAIAQSGEWNFSGTCQVKIVTTAVIEPIKCLHSSLRGLSSQFNAKLTIERDLATASPKLHTTNECVLVALVSVVTCVAKLSTFLSENIPSSETDSLCRIRGIPLTVKAHIDSRVGQFHWRANQYLNSLEEDELDSVPFEMAVDNRNKVEYLTDRTQTLERQLESSQTKIQTLERAKEHWMLEFQLLQMKHEKLQKRCLSVESMPTNGSQHDSSGGGEMWKGADDSTSSPMVEAEADHTGLLGSIEKVSDGKSSSAQSSEDELRAYFTKRINELVSQIQICDSKAVTYHSELVAVQRRLHLALRGRQHIELEVAQREQANAKLKEELSITASSYEAQLSTMSEHLANMNSKLTAQKDEIDALKYTIAASASTKKGMFK